jgi:hypothetical protein
VNVYHTLFACSVQVLCGSFTSSEAPVVSWLLLKVHSFEVTGMAPAQLSFDGDDPLTARPGVAARFGFDGRSVRPGFCDDPSGGFRCRLAVLGKGRIAASMRTKNDTRFLLTVSLMAFLPPVAVDVEKDLPISRLWVCGIMPLTYQTLRLEFFQARRK